MHALSVSHEFVSSINCDFGTARPVLLLIARIAVVLIFIIFGFPKMMGFDGTVQYMASLGAPMPMLAAIIAVVMEVPAGHLEADETLVEAAARELWEETGLIHTRDPFDARTIPKLSDIINANRIKPEY